MHLKPYKSLFFFVDRNTNRILPFSKPIPRIEFEQRRILGLQYVRQGTSFSLSRAAKRQGVLDRIFLFVLIEDCVFWPKATWKPWEKTVDPLLLLLLLLLPPVQSILTEPDCFEGLLFRLWFWYDITYYVELSLFQKRVPTHKRGGYNYNVKSDITKNLLWMSTLVFPIQHCIGVENTDNIIFDHCS